MDSESRPGAFRLERELVERLASIGFITLGHCFSVWVMPLVLLPRRFARRRVRVRFTTTTA